MFSDVIGYEDIKKAFRLFLQSESNTNILLAGPPGCAKTLFLLGLMKNLRDSFFVDGGNATGPGMFDQLLSKKGNTKFLLIDEIDGLKRTDQKALLNLLETGILSSTKVRRQANKEFKNLKVVGTCNNSDMLSKAMRSRFFILELHEYSEQEFLEIAEKLYPKKDPILTEYIAKAVWHVLDSKDVRDFQKIADNANSAEEADLLIELKVKYQNSEEEE